ncbi:type II secretion system protein [Ureibacillus aquaedulcis]|uniref:Type II secretion system protein n=1 Tax=Ureibacillus aquaedulcis TaxID=3058421 RepID=A0ABT8GVR8_9BACL|nr:type II secretion system protein [Ureibacillus sp. BA0131]MDN4495515.1 type II secretion system protein [Ureibacillus sp. BA0131]
MQQTPMQKQKHKQNNKLKGGFNMFKNMKKRIKNEKGLTLIELLAVIVILAIVAAIAVPAIGNIIDNSRIKAAKADVVNAINAANIYYTDNEGVLLLQGTANASGTTAPIADLNDYLESPGTLTITKVEKTSDGIELTGTAKVGTDTYTVNEATLINIKQNTADPVTDVFFKAS